MKRKAKIFLSHKDILEAVADLVVKEYSDLESKLLEINIKITGGNYSAVVEQVKPE